MKRYLRIFILTVVVGLSGGASGAEGETEVSSNGKIRN